jgi:hypothetical protein
MPVAGHWRLVVALGVLGLELREDRGSGEPPGTRNKEGVDALVVQVGTSMPKTGLTPWAENSLSTPVSVLRLSAPRRLARARMQAHRTGETVASLRPTAGNSYRGNRPCFDQNHPSKAAS